jgi:hypothetical protein
MKDDLPRFADPFLIENGLEQVQAYFPNVELLRYEDNLRVTEVEPILAYVRSGIRAAYFSEEEFAKIEKELRAKLERDGDIFITKDSGMFVCMK